MPSFSRARSKGFAIAIQAPEAEMAFSALIAIALLAAPLLIDGAQESQAGKAPEMAAAVKTAAASANDGAQEVQPRSGGKSVVSDHP